MPADDLIPQQVTWHGPAPVKERGVKRLADSAKATLLQLLGGLFMEQKDEDGDGKAVWVASLGRVAFWIVFGHMVWLFQKGAAVSPEELNVFYALLAYQGAKIGKDALTEGVAAWKNLTQG